MAKKRTDNQTQIPGTERNESEAVNRAAEAYDEALRERKSWKEKEDSTRDELIATMKDEEVEECQTEHYTFSIIDRGSALKRRKRKEDSED